MILNTIKSKTCPPRYIQIDMNLNTILAYKDTIGDANIYDKLDTNITSDPNQSNNIIIRTLTDIKAETMPSRTVKFKKNTKYLNGLLEVIVVQ